MIHTTIKLVLIMLAIIGTMNCVAAEEDVLEVLDFLYSDTTDSREYTKWRYDCGYFTRDLARNASMHNITLGGAILSNNPTFSRYNNHIINYFEANGELYFIAPQTDRLMDINTIFMDYKYIKLYPDGRQVPSRWNDDLDYTIADDDSW